MAILMQLDAGERRLLAALMRMRQLGASPSPIFQAIAAYGENSTRQRFVRQAGPDGRRWKVSARVAAGLGRDTLRLSNNLLRSITARHGQGFAEWGTNVPYARIHNEGGVIRPKAGKALRFPVGRGWATVSRVTMPARTFIGLNDDDIEEIGEIALDAVREAEAGGAHAG